MHTTRTVAAVAAFAVASLSAPALRAQVAEVSRTPLADAAQLTFGFLCDDRFVIRNDGTQSVDVEYGLERGSEHTRLTLGARESVELSSKSKNALELWKDGKLVAKASKQRRSCKDVQGNASVTVRPLEVAETDDSRARANYGVGYPYYDPWGFGAYYGYGFGFRPYYSSVIVVGGRGGGGGGGGRRGR